MRSALSAVGFLLLAVPAVAQVRITVTTDQPEYLRGEPIVVVLEVNNESAGPVGYVNGQRSAGQLSLCPDPARATLVRRAFELVASGQHTPADALRIITALGLQTRSGRALSPQTFGALLRNPIYAGFLEAGGFGLGRTRGDFEALVPEGVFLRVQALLQRSNGVSARRLDHPDYPLRRFVVCDACNTPLTGSAPKGRSKNYRYYHCRRCRGISIRAEALEAQFIELLESLRPKSEFLGLFRAIVLQAWESRRQDTRKLSADLEEKLANLQRREIMLEEAYLYRNAIDETTYARQRDALREQIALVRLEQQDARVEEIDVEGLLAYAEFALENAARLWTESRSEQRQCLQRVLFPHGLRFKDQRIGTGRCPAVC